MSCYSSKSLLIYRFLSPPWLLFSWQFFAKKLGLCPTVFPVAWLLLFTSPWCYLPCSSVSCSFVNFKLMLEQWFSKVAHGDHLGDIKNPEAQENSRSTTSMLWRWNGGTGIFKKLLRWSHYTANTEHHFSRFLLVFSFHFSPLWQEMFVVYFILDVWNFQRGLCFTTQWT